LLLKRFFKVKDPYAARFYLWDLAFALNKAKNLSNIKLSEIAHPLTLVFLEGAFKSINKPFTKDTTVNLFLKNLFFF